MDRHRNYCHRFCAYLEPMNPGMLNRKTVPVGLLAALLILNVLVFVFEKTAAMASVKDVHAAFYFSLIKQPWLWIGLAIGPFQLWIWARILHRTDLSVAYPLSSISYPVTMVIAQLVFGEHLGWQVWLGAVFMTIGVAAIGSTAAQAPDHFNGGAPRITPRVAG